MGERRTWFLPVIVVSQFASTSVWFAGNAVMDDLQRRWHLPDEALGDITAAVQLGFIAGTLAFAILAISDRFSPRKTYLVSSLLAAACNAAPCLVQGDFTALFAFRFLTGFCLAGIYPIGMKIASGWYPQDLGRVLGFLIGALVFGTAFPHLIRGIGQSLPWQAVLLAASAAALAGGILMFALVPDGPHLGRSARFDPAAFAAIFRSRTFRASAFGYFGHMWELYALWTFAPALMAAHAARSGAGIDISLWTFAMIAVGGLGCIGGGLASLRLGSARVARAQLLASGLCCLLSPAAFLAPMPVFLAFLLFWGVVVVGDSPQFSALNARYAPRDLVGSALTITNCIGFAITIASIQLINYVAGDIGPQLMFLLLAPGPFFGLLALKPLLTEPDAARH